jgi:hypothetical protein
MSTLGRLPRNVTAINEMSMVVLDRPSHHDHADFGGVTPGIPIADDPMAYDSGKRLLLYALVKGLGDAVRRNDQSAAKRYRRRLRLATEQIAADDPVQDALKKLLLISGQWVAAPVVTMSPKGEGSERYVYRSDRDEPKQQMLELIERVIDLLPS